MSVNHGGQYCFFYFSRHFNPSSHMYFSDHIIERSVESFRNDGGSGL